MSVSAERSNEADDLRARAEHRLATTRRDVQSLPIDDARELVHELQVHQIELELQNEELRRAQVELEASRDAYLDLYDFAPVGYLTLDPMGVIREANLTAATLLGVERKGLVGRKLAHFAVRADQDTLFRHCREVLSTGARQTCEIRIKAPTGMSPCVRLEMTAVEDEKGSRNECRAVLIDITQRRQAEEALRASEEKHRSIVDNIGIGVALISPKMEILGLNRQMRTWFPKVDAGQHPICHQAFNDPPRDGICNHCPTCETLRDGQVHESVTDTPQAGGIRNYRVVSSPIHDEAGAVVAAIEMVDDVTERRWAEEALRESAEKFRGLVESTFDWIWEVNAEGVYVYASPQIEAMLGYKPDEVVGKTPADLMAPEGAEQIAEVIKDALETGKPVVMLENVNLHKDGRRIVLETSGVSVRDSAGQVTGFRGVDRDITDRKRAEEELARYRDHLEQLVQERAAELETAHQKLLQQQRLATLGQLTATVSHELRNPLGTIRASFFAIAEETHGKELGIEDVLDRAERNILRCDAIIEELLDYARTKETDLSPTRVDEWLAHVLDEQRIPAGIHLKRSLAAGLEIPMDREKLRRCVINLVTNACQAIQEGKQTGGGLTVETAGAGNRLEMRFIDSGPGIPPERMEKIFEPLYSTKGFGVGLGLPIVRQIAELHGGGIEIESESGEGTRATLWLPLMQPEGRRDEQVAYSSSR